MAFVAALSGFAHLIYTSSFLSFFLNFVLAKVNSKNTLVTDNLQDNVLSELCAL